MKNCNSNDYRSKLEKKESTSICNEQTFSEVYLHQADKLFHFIYYKSGDSGLAEDVVQDTFVKLWQNCSKVKLENAAFFLFRVAKNIFLNKMGRKKVALKFQSQLKEETEKGDPEFILQKKEFQSSLENAINQLTEAQREVFLLNRIDGLKYREIAELLGISQKAVEKRMHKALKELRKLNDRI